MAPFSYKTITGPFLGVDYQPNELERNDNAAGDMLNAHITPDNLISQRPGTIGGSRFPTFTSPVEFQHVSIYPNSLFTGFIATSDTLSISFSPRFMAVAADNDGSGTIAYSTPVTATRDAFNVSETSHSLSASAIDGAFHYYTYNSSNTVTSDLVVGTGNELNPQFSLAWLAANGPFAGFTPPVSGITGESSALAAASIVALGPFDWRLGRFNTSNDRFTRSFQVWAQNSVTSGAGTKTTVQKDFFIGITDPSQSLSVVDSVTFNGTTTYFTADGQLYKIDGVRGYVPAAPYNGLTSISITDVTAGNVDIGTHHYAWQFRYYDPNGGFVDGPLVTNNTNGDVSNPSPTAPFSVTVSATTKIVDVALTLTPYSLAAPTLGYSSADSSATSTNTITGLTGHGFVAGDQIIVPLYNAGTAQISSIARAKILSTTSSSVTLDRTIPSYRAGFFTTNATILLWRTAVSGTEYEFVGESTFDATDGVTTHLLDNIADANLGGAYIPLAYVPGTVERAGQGNSVFPLSNYPINPLPNFMDYLAIHNNLLVAASGQTVLWSLPDNMDTWAADQNSFIVPMDPGDEITGIRSAGGTLYIWTKETLWSVTGGLPQPGASDTSFNLAQVSSSVGCVNHKSITRIEGMIVWMGKLGLYSITPGSLPRVIDTPLRPLYIGLNNTDTTDPIVDTGRACYDPNRRLFFCSVTLQDTSFARHQFTVVWNIQNGGSWEIWSGLDTTTGVTYLPGYGPYFVDFSGRFSRFSDSEPGVPDSFKAADGVNPIPFSYTGSWEEMGAPSVAKNFTRFRLLAGQSGGAEQHFTLDVNLQKDYSLGSAGSKTMDFGSTTGFGLEAYGMAPYGDPTKSGLNMKPRTSKARAMRPVFTNNKLYEKVKIMGWEYEISPDFKQNKGNK